MRSKLQQSSRKIWTFVYQKSCFLNKTFIFRMHEYIKAGNRHQFSRLAFIYLVAIEMWR